jgi:hypothetical protein
VPEERHLLLQGPFRVHHPEQPALTRVLDIQIGREAGARGDRCVGGIADLRIDVIGLLFVIEQIVQNTRRRGPLERPKFGLAGAEAGPAQQVIDAQFTSCHDTSPCTRLTANPHPD